MFVRTNCTRLSIVHCGRSLGSGDHITVVGPSAPETTSLWSVPRLRRPHHCGRSLGSGDHITVVGPSAPGTTVQGRRRFGEMALLSPPPRLVPSPPELWPRSWRRQCRLAEMNLHCYCGIRGNIRIFVVGTTLFSSRDAALRILNVSERLAVTREQL